MTKAEFEVLYMKHQKPWLDLARSLVKNEDTAQDVLQGVIVRLMARRGGLRRIHLHDNPSSWIRAQIIWYVKRFVWLNPDNREDQANNAIALGGFELILHSPEPEEEQTETPQEQGVRAALARLAVIDQDILCLHVVANMPFAEIRKILGIRRSTGALKKHYFVNILPHIRLELKNVGISSPTCADNRKLSKDQTAA